MTDPLQPPHPEFTLCVVARTDSFSLVWKELAEDFGCLLRFGDQAQAVPSDGGAVVLSVAGVESQARDALVELRTRCEEPIAVVGSTPDHHLATTMIKEGASEYFALPADLTRLRSWLEERVEGHVARRRAEILTAAERSRYDFSGMVGESRELHLILDRAARVIPRAETTVLITGETGTGKELLAQAIHYQGPRSGAPFVAVNCSALPPQLLESELFGHEKGAFTDANATKTGLFEAANGGTLLLDEIGDLQPNLQAKILRALEDRRVRRLGSIHWIDLDVRLIAATNVDLGKAVADGHFREDLYYRLNVIPLHLPALRDRGEDWLLLARRFLDQLAERYDMQVPELSNDVQNVMRAYDWPGNIRELRNAIERALLLGDGQIKAEDLFMSVAVKTSQGPLPFPATLAEIERAAAQEMLKRLGGNKKAAAQQLGISRSRLYRLLEAP